MTRILGRAILADACNSKVDGSAVTGVPMADIGVRDCGKVLLHCFAGTGVTGEPSTLLLQSAITRAEKIGVWEAAVNRYVKK